VEKPIESCKKSQLSRIKKANWVVKKANWIVKKSQLSRKKSQVNRQKKPSDAVKKPIESSKKSQLKKMVVKKPQSIVVLLFLPDIIKMQAVQN